MRKVDNPNSYLESQKQDLVVIAHDFWKIRRLKRNYYQNDDNK